MRRIKKLGFIATTVGLVLGGVAVGSALAVTEREVRESQFIDGLSDTRSEGQYDFLEEGLRVRTGDNTAAAGQPSNNKVAEYFALSGSIPETATYEWFGTGNGTDLLNQPGSQIVFDVDQTVGNNGPDGNSNDYNVLVGEKVYGTTGESITDWWYPGGQTRAAARGFTCPQTDSASGSNCHGTLAEWRQTLPDARVYAGGFSLGSGVKGDGVLRSLTFGDDQYVFTDQAAPEPAPETQDTTATYTRTLEGKTARIQMDSAALQPGKVAGAKINFLINVDGVDLHSNILGPSDRSVYKVVLAKGTHTIKITKKGKLQETWRVTVR